jgi:hypothetical protein
MKKKVLKLWQLIHVDRHYEKKKNSTKCKLIAATEKNKSQSRALDGTIKFN